MLVKNWIKKKCFKVIGVIAYRSVFKLIKDNFKSIIIQIIKWKLRLAVMAMRTVLVYRAVTKYVTLKNTLAYKI